MTIIIELLLRNSENNIRIHVFFLYVLMCSDYELTAMKRHLFVLKCEPLLSNGIQLLKRLSTIYDQTTAANCTSFRPISPLKVTLSFQFIRSALPKWKSYNPTVQNSIPLLKVQIVAATMRNSNFKCKCSLSDFSSLKP